MEKKNQFQKSVKESIKICQELKSNLDKAKDVMPNKHISDIAVKIELISRDLKRVYRETEEFIK